MEDQNDDVGNTRTRRGTAHWSQPCTNLAYNSNNTKQSLSEYILLAVDRAYNYMETFKANYTQETLGMNWTSAVENHTKGQSVTFINAVTAPDTADINFDKQLLEAYELMQRVAVGIEQVTLDQALYQGTFLQEFRKIETHIVHILCQLHYAMVHQGLKPSEPVTKEIMGEEYRDLEGESARAMRDTIIVREYDSALQYLQGIFTNFKQQ